ncbi:hypothetical protein C437_13935 [Haloarcula vallismortis ATCC 29715]|uniref:Polysaccharide lyase 14 domain-containing protein n=1 Tax=Haloarcula vallismortis ATCC 29715 TaxID=662477 RepID=M0J696_HALVA|nr:hypothetical protein [Haloarcula vallismortis]EMA04652.1 hypothetical protein C437_13935 [Haloarcula vallismortis ATCC 29715]
MASDETEEAASKKVPTGLNKEITESIEDDNKQTSQRRLNRRSVLQLTGGIGMALAGGYGVASAEELATPSADSEVDVKIGFNDRSYTDKFTYVGRAENNSIINGKHAYSDKSLSVKFAEGDHYGTDMRYRFSEEGYSEPETLYFRYYVYFPQDFEVVENGGKLPGPVGTYGTAGWGGRQSDGTNGWSARMSFTPGSDSDHVQVGWYCYHADMGTWGSNWAWSKNEAGNVLKGQWHQIVGEVKMNTPEENDGVLRGWVNGDFAFEKTDIRFRDTTDLKIQDFWFDNYYGGSWASPSDNEVRFDSLRMWTESANETTDPTLESIDSDNKGHTVAFISEEGSSTVNYDFTSGGSVEFTTASYETPAGKPIEGGTWEGVDYIEEGSEVVMAGGGTGEGYGDAYLVTGPVLNATIRTPDDMWIELNGEKVTTEQLIERTAWQ